jgi:Mg2+/citrate symporter
VGRIFDDIHAWTIAAVVALAMVIAWLLGRWIGARLRLDLHGAKPAVSKFLDASLTLLGLLIAFTFATAIGQHEQRRLMVVADSNAVADFYVCASLLKEPERTKLRNVIRDYAALRIDLSKRVYDTPGFEKALGQFDQMHRQMVALVSEALADGTPIAVSLTNTLNAVSSNQAARLAAARDRLPTTIVMLLLTSAVLVAMLVGREQGVMDEEDIAGTLCFVFLVSFAIFVTLDLNQPNRGFIVVDQEPIHRLLSTITE